MKSYVWKPCRDLHWMCELRFSISRYLEQCATENNHLLYNWPTIHNAISKICPKFQALSFHFSEVDDLLLSAWRVLGKNCAKRKYNNSNLCLQFKAWPFFSLELLKKLKKQRPALRHFRNWIQIPTLMMGLKFNTNEIALMLHWQVWDLSVSLCCADAWVPVWLHNSH